MKEWLKRFNQQVLVLKKMSGIDDDLRSAEAVELLKDKLKYQVVTRLNTAFKNSGKTWATVTYADLHKILKEEYGSKVADVCEVLIQFGPSRLKKTPDMSVAKFDHLWQEQLPECMTPGDDNALCRTFAV